MVSVAPLVLLLLTSGAMISALLTQRRRQPPTLLLSRYFLIFSLYDRMEDLPRTIGLSNTNNWERSAWEKFCDELEKILEKLEEEIQKVSIKVGTLGWHKEELENADDGTQHSQTPGSEWFDRPEIAFVNDTMWHHAVSRLAGVIDKELVSFLHLYPGLSKLLSDYLPKKDQTWVFFLESTLDPDDAESRSYLNSELGEHNNHEDQNLQCATCAFRVELVSSLLHLVVQLKEFSRNFDLQDEIRNVPLSGDDIEENGDLVPLSGGEVTSSSVAMLYSIVKVFYATDRQVTQDGDYIGVFSKRGRKLQQSPRSHSSSLHFGFMEVGIPTTHRTGSTVYPRGSEDADPVKHVVVLSADTKLRDKSGEFVKMVNDDLALLRGASENEVLVFIHGYNVSHKAAVKRTAQLKHDLEFGGVVVAYSWSSQGELIGYVHDEKSAERTVPCLESFLWLITEEFTKAERIHILAHSMGNRPLIRALTNFYGEDQKDARLRCSRTPISQIVLAAADEDRRKVEKLLNLLRRAPEEVSTSRPERTTLTTTIAENDYQANDANASSTTSDPHVTVYSATDDVALHFSKTLHFKMRLGDTYSFINSNSSSRHEHDKISDVVDASGLGEGKWQLGHSYYGDTPQVIQDIRILLKEKKRAEARGLHRCTVKGNKFYTFNREKWAKRLGCA